MPERERDVLLLHTVAELTYEQLVGLATYGGSRATVVRFVARARSIFEQLFEELTELFAGNERGGLGEPGID
jgi:hypothetical protein